MKEERAEQRLAPQPPKRVSSLAACDSDLLFLLLLLLEGELFGRFLPLGLVLLESSRALLDGQLRLEDAVQSEALALRHRTAHANLDNVADVALLLCTDEQTQRQKGRVRNNNGGWGCSSAIRRAARLSFC